MRPSQPPLKNGGWGVGGWGLGVGGWGLGVGGGGLGVGGWGLGVGGWGLGVGGWGKAARCARGSPLPLVARCGPWGATILYPNAYLLTAAPAADFARFRHIPHERFGEVVGSHVFRGASVQPGPPGMLLSNPRVLC